MSQLQLTTTTPILEEIRDLAVRTFGKENLLNPEIDFHRKDERKRSIKVWNNKDKTYWVVFKTPSINIEMKVSENSILNQ